MSNMLEQAIIDAEALKEAALKNAEQSILEKYSKEIRNKIDTLLEQEEPQPLMDQVPYAVTEGEDMCPCPETEETVRIEFADLRRMADEEGMAPPEAAMMPPEAGMMAPEGGMMPMGLEAEQEEDALALMMEGGEAEEDYIVLEEDQYSRPTNMPGGNLGGPQPKTPERDPEEPVSLEEGQPEGKGEVTLPQGSHDVVVNEAELENPEKADLDDDGKLSGYEKTRGAAIEKAMSEEIQITEEDLADVVEALMVDVKPVPSGVPGGGTNNADLEEYADEAEADLQNEIDGGLVPGVGIRANHQAEEALSENKTLKSLNNKYKNRLTNLEEKNNNYRDLLEKLKVRLEEVNLVNAKLLYTNRTLNSDSLNERQKNNIVEAISKVQSVEEAKIVYETLQSTVGTRKRKRAPQSLSEAVKRSSTILPRRNNEAKPSDPVSDRWKVLAGINNKEK